MRREGCDAVRDLERQRTYDAETRAFEGTLVEAPLTFAEVLELSETVTATPWWRRHGVPVTFVRGKGTAIHSHFDRANGRITLTEVQQTPATVAHELAHAASDDGHGPRFRGAHCALVHGLCGAGPARSLRAEYMAEGLDVADLEHDGLPDPPVLARHPRFGP